MAGKLNDGQRKAVEHQDGPMLVLAGPGSGKTTVILCRLRRLLSEEKNRDKGILIVTFTRAAAAEMRQRFGKRTEGNVLFSTFHSLFFRILRRAYGYRADQIIDDEEKHRVIARLIEDERISLEDIEETVNRFIAQASLMMGEMTALRDFIPEDMEESLFRKLFKGYEAYKARHEKLDFDDMLLQCYELLEGNKRELDFWRKQFPYIMVDEFQDINRVQYECLRLLAAPENNLFVVGDDDQSIYRFRGARPEYMLDFEKHYPSCGKVVLNINYRSTDNIIAVAERVIKANDIRFKKSITGVRGEGIKPVFFMAEDSAAEAEWIGEKISALLDDGIPMEETAVIFRTNIQGGIFARALHRRGIPYTMRDKGGNIYEHWITKDILAYILLSENPNTDSALRRIINKPKRYIGKDILEEAEKMPYSLLRSIFVCPSLKKWQADNLEVLIQDMEQVRKRSQRPYDAVRYIRGVIGYDQYLEDHGAYRHTGTQVFFDIADEITELAKGCKDTTEFCREIEEMSLQREENKKNNGRGVVLTTIHGAKGLEFYGVFLPCLTEGVFPHEKAMGDIEEERRLFYVGLTRAKKRLFLSASKSRYNKEAKPSRFLKEAGIDAAALLEAKKDVKDVKGV